MNKKLFVLWAETLHSSWWSFFFCSIKAGLFENILAWWREGKKRSKNADLPISILKTDLKKKFNNSSIISNVDLFVNYWKNILWFITWKNLVTCQKKVPILRSGPGSSSDGWSVDGVKHPHTLCMTTVI